MVKLRSFGDDIGCSLSVANEWDMIYCLYEKTSRF